MSSTRSRWSFPWGVAILLSPAIAAAHPGHGQTDPQSWVHWLTEPVHVLPAAVVASAVVLGGVLLRRRRRSTP